MTNQEAFDKLAELEEFFFYKLKNPAELDNEYFMPILYQMHEDVKTLVRQWHNLTGCKNQ